MSVKPESERRTMSIITWGLRPQTPDTVTRGAPTPLRSGGSLAPLVRCCRLAPSSPDPDTVTRGAPTPLRSGGSLAPLVRCCLSPGELRPQTPDTVTRGAPTPLRSGGSLAPLVRCCLSPGDFVPRPLTPSLAGPRPRSVPVAHSRRSFAAAVPGAFVPRPRTPSLAGPRPRSVPVAHSRRSFAAALSALLGSWKLGGPCLAGSVLNQGQPLVKTHRRTEKGRTQERALPGPVPCAASVRRLPLPHRSPVCSWQVSVLD